MEKSRLPGYSSRESLPDDALPWADEILKTRKYILGPVAWALPYVPETTTRIAALGDQVRNTHVLGKDHIQLASLIAVHFVGNAYMWQAHLKTAAKAGVVPAAIDALKSNGPLDELPKDCALLLRYGREIFGAPEVSQATFDTMHARFGATGMMELATVFGYYVMMSCIAKTAGVQPDTLPSRF